MPARVVLLKGFCLRSEVSENLIISARGKAHSTKLDSGVHYRWSNGLRGGGWTVRNYGAYFGEDKLHRSPEYLLRDWSFLTARPRAFFCPTTTSNRLARVIPV